MSQTELSPGGALTRLLVTTCWCVDCVMMVIYYCVRMVICYCVKMVICYCVKMAICYCVKIEILVIV